MNKPLKTCDLVAVPDVSNAQDVIRRVKEVRSRLHAAKPKPAFNPQAVMASKSKEVVASSVAERPQHKLTGKPWVDRIILFCARRYKVPPLLLLVQMRTHNVAKARTLAMMLVAGNRQHGVHLSRASLGSIFRRDPTTVSSAIDKPACKRRRALAYAKRRVGHDA